MSERLPISVAIPTYRREGVLLNTLRDLLVLAPAEIIVLDQTEQHEPATEQALRQLDDAGQIRWLRLGTPSIPQAMNRGLLEAREDLVLFVDDDIRPAPNLLTAHVEAHMAHADVLVAGRVTQPWETDPPPAIDRFHFNCVDAAWTDRFMGGNFSLRRGTALTLGGFDENFVRVAYQFEAEFAHRFCRNGRRIRFEPRAHLYHLKTGSGGTRTYGEHLTTWRPDHAVGAYYYGLRSCALGEFFSRPVRAIATRFHLRHPWRIPGTLLAEVGGMLWAIGLYMRGPRRLRKRPQESA